MTRLILATRNPKKLRELEEILAEAHLDITLEPLPDSAPDVVEDGLTFAQNAVKKARSAAQATGLPAVADDSGLCVDALNEMPGVLSARWAGSGKDDAANLALVLDQLRDVPDTHLGAHFACAMALALPGGEDRVVEGRMDGSLVREPRGAGGFGYYPAFVPDGHDLTTAEMSAAEKHAVSHRGRALRALVPVLGELLG
jgi:XTP/dITP diphosphohydrolase